ncbi:unnamed protein product [Rhizoctonia solani]|uniref:Uncharacterized protein n=1 Tax=Rhizoctonia solani TaxID=456999 RepID=A0A8H3HAM1_9AGAM|nr:unnamed protein product [Rhizoctonia solani]
MSRKTGGTGSLSNGTLSLRFMQRGASQKVTAATAKVTDEAEWDIGPIARAAWGVTSSDAKASSINVTRDDSYLPFVFDFNAPDSTNQQSSRDESEVEPARRRIFRKGTEIKHEACSADAVNSSNETEKSETKAESDMKTNGSPDATRGHPKAISSPGKPNPSHVPNKPGIRRHRLEGFLKPSATPSTGFLKPSGVSSASGTRRKRTYEGDITAPRGKTMRAE